MIEREMVVTHVSTFGLKRQSNNTNQGQMKHELIETYYLPVHNSYSPDSTQLLNHQLLIYLFMNKQSWSILMM